MKKHFPAILLLTLIVFSCGRKPADQKLVQFKGVAFGTYYSVSYYEGEAVDYQESIDSLFSVFNQSLSYYNPASLISQINRGEADQPDDFFRPVFIRAWEISAESGGAFDATVSPLVNAWGFGFKNKEEVTPALIDSLLEFVGFEKVYLADDRIVKLDDRVQFDFNAIAKGYAADVAGAFLESKGIEVYLVEIGGDLLARGVKPDGSHWRIGLELPAETMDSPQEWNYMVEIRDNGVATSGNYRRYFEENGQRYSHTIDPQTGYPVKHNLLSVSVFAPDAMSADAYATAFMVMGLDKALAFVEAREELDAYFISSNEEGEFTSLASSGLSLKSKSN
jgi:FAD:protein FMN transferase